MEKIDLEQYSEELLDLISANVAYYRKEKGYSQMQLALEIGMSGGAYLGRAEIRKNNHHYNIKHLAKISKVLEIDICDFFKPIKKKSTFIESKPTVTLETIVGKS